MPQSCLVATAVFAGFDDECEFCRQRLGSLSGFRFLGGSHRKLRPLSRCQYTILKRQTDNVLVARVVVATRRGEEGDQSRLRPKSDDSLNYTAHTEAFRWQPHCTQYHDLKETITS